MVKSSKKGDNLVVKSKLNVLIAQKEFNEGRKITNKEIADETGLAPNTVGNWMSPGFEIHHIRSQVLTSLCRYVPCDITDLIYLDTVE